MLNYNEDIQANKITPRGYCFDTADSGTARSRRSRLKKKLIKYANTDKRDIAIEYARLQTERDLLNDKLKQLDILLSD